jgi:hypothetical protein
MMTVGPRRCRGGAAALAVVDAGGGSIAAGASYSIGVASTSRSTNGDSSAGTDADIAS